MQSNILIAEDDKHLNLLIADKLRSRYNVETSFDGLDAWSKYESLSVDLVITDISMPGMDGYELAGKIRTENAQIPILMLTANQSFDAKRIGFSSGVDDYLTKPFDNEELLWRVNALFRRFQINRDHVVSLGDVQLNKSTYLLSREDSSIQLPKKEFDLLYKFFSEPGRIFTKHQLMESIWGYDSDSSEDTIKTHISRLRRNIKDFPEISVMAIKGIGYKVEVEV